MLLPSFYLFMSDRPAGLSSSSAHAKEKSPPASSSSATDDIEKLLNREASAFQREVEVERILKAFKLKCVSSVLDDLSSTDYS